MFNLKRLHGEIYFYVVSKSETKYLSVFITVILCLTAPSRLSFAQTQKDKKIEDFGYSLRIRADKKNQKEPEARSNEKIDEDVIRIKTDLVTSSFLVIDNQHRFVTNLKKEDFIVKEDDNPQTIEMFSTSDEKTFPRSIVLIIDCSVSQTAYIQTSAEAAKKLIDKLSPQDKMAIVTDSVELLVNFTKDKNLLKKKLDFLVNHYRQLRIKRGLSVQYTALLATLNELVLDEDIRPIILFQTDGDEFEFLNLPSSEQIKNDSWKIQKEKFRYFSFDELKQKIEKSRATIYSIIPGFSFIGLSPEEQIRQAQNQFSSSVRLTNQYLGIQTEVKNIISEKQWSLGAQITLRRQLAMGEISDLSGGWADFLQTSAQADDLYSRILSDINSRYVIGYYPTNQIHDGKRRTITVKIRNHPEYIIQGRKTYIAPGC